MKVISQCSCYCKPRFGNSRTISLQIDSLRRISEYSVGLLEKEIAGEYLWRLAVRYERTSTSECVTLGP